MNITLCICGCGDVADHMHHAITRQTIHRHPEGRSMNRRYLVVVVDPTPQPGQGINSSATPRYNAPQWVTAASKERAVENAKPKVQPGGFAYVVAEQDVRRYSRATEAPLVERHGEADPYYCCPKGSHDVEHWGWMA